MKIINKISEHIISDKNGHFLYFSSILILLLVLCFIFFPIRPGHDYLFHIRRFSVLIDAISKGDFFIYLDYGTLEQYGYFTKGFYPDLTLMPFALIGTFTGPFVAYEIMIYTMAFLCGVFTYQATKRVFHSSAISFVSAILFTFSYYKLVDTYLRAALGETLAFTFIPLIFWGLYEIIKGNHRKWYILTIGMSLTILSHVISSIIVCIPILLIVIFSYKHFIKSHIRFYSLLLSVGATILVTAYFIFPLLELISSDTFYYQVYMWNHATGHEFYRIIWDMLNGILPTIKSKFMVGCGIVITWIIGLRLFITQKSELLKKADSLLIIGLICLFIMSPLYPWNTFPFSILNIIQFSWRLYLIISFFFAVGGSIYLYIALKTDLRRVKIGIPLVIILTAIMIVSSGQDYQNTIHASDTNETTASFKNRYVLYGGEYLPAKVPQDPADFVHSRLDSIGRNNPNTVVSALNRERNLLKLNVNVSSPDTLELPLIHYIGYKATINGIETQISESDNGLINVTVSEPADIEVYYAGTSTQKISWGVTLISILGLCIYILLVNKGRKNSG